MPARPLHLAWRHCDSPVEWSSTHRRRPRPNFVVPPTRKAARVMSVQDLTPVRFPELCDPATLVFPSLVARASTTALRARLDALHRRRGARALQVPTRAGRRGQPRLPSLPRPRAPRRSPTVSEVSGAMCSPSAPRSRGRTSLAWSGPSTTWRPRRPTSPRAGRPARLGSRRARPGDRRLAPRLAHRADWVDR